MKGFFELASCCCDLISILVFDLECVSVVEKSVALVVVTKGVNKG